MLVASPAIVAFSATSPSVKRYLASLEPGPYLTFLAPFSPVRIPAGAKPHLKILSG
ncbi:hypothetical protein JMJ77_0011138 [Colletotrichum scovillei]|uniref:Uncharacterized protein n=1 Tax=Colletotrichum scovillei TaxID=1209932 RepID=A0A9P7R1J2_9PEZI|nr:hypothetical protein JMJ77_0011138 [Colletotrichum scovillei]KAG7060115.1 hypothetical protein JMJ78_0015394 [Colletotrichum scovillei]KAG7067563.1 hypothetical protein JMJ76_0008995 [Colletotrichum scovillei]